MTRAQAQRKLQKLVAHGERGTSDGAIQPEQIEQVLNILRMRYSRAETNDRIADVFGAIGLSDRRCDTTLQILRRAGLAKHLKGTGANNGWREVEPVEESP